MQTGLIIQRKRIQIQTGCSQTALTRVMSLSSICLRPPRLPPPRERPPERLQNSPKLKRLGEDLLLLLLDEDDLLLLLLLNILISSSAHAQPCCPLNTWPAWVRGRSLYLGQSSESA